MMQAIRWPELFMWGFVATLILTTMLSASQGLGLTRMDMPYMLGTMFTADRDRARWLGFLLHFLNGWVFALIYSMAIIMAHRGAGIEHWWFGMAVGLVHGLAILILGMSIMPSIHPRMADDQHGPDPTRQLEPPGFLALNYGRQTPVTTLVAHLIYGGILGFFTH